MAGVSRGCWPAQGGLLPGLLVASMTELVVVVVVCRGLGAGTRPTDQLAKPSSSGWPHLESKDLKRFLGADWTQADVHFKGLWLQRTSAGCVWGLCQSYLDRYIGREQARAWWPYHGVTTTLHPPLTEQKQTLKQVQRIGRGLAKVHLLGFIHLNTWCGSLLLASCVDAFQFKLWGFKASSKWVILASLKHYPLHLLMLAVWFQTAWYSLLCFFHYFITSEYNLA